MPPARTPTASVSVAWPAKSPIPACAASRRARAVWVRWAGARPSRCFSVGVTPPISAAKPRYLRAEHGAPRAGEEPGLDEHRHDLRLGDGPPVEALDRKPRPASRADVRDERLDRRPQPFLVRFA